MNSAQTPLIKFPFGSRFSLLFWLTVLAFTIHPVSAQVQLGGDLDAEGPGDFFGSSVTISANGTRTAIGGPRNDQFGSFAGHVRIYEYNGSNWVQMGPDLDAIAAGDQMGFSVSMSADGSRLAAASPGFDGVGSNSGMVRIYEYNGSNWNQLGSSLEGEAAIDNFGRDIDLSADGNRLVVGAFLNDGTASNAGHARVFEYNGSDWVQLGADIDGEAVDDRSGDAVSISGNGTRVAVGAYQNDDGGPNSGHVRVYEYNGSSWVQLGADIDGEANWDQSGQAVELDLDGDRVAIGAPDNDGNGSAAGHVRVYEYNGSSWVQLGADIDGEFAGDFSGNALDIIPNGNRVIIGAHLNDALGTTTGHARIFEYTGSNWVQVGTDIDGEAAGDACGTAVAISEFGGRVIVGAYHNQGSGANAGHGRVFTMNPVLSAEWIELFLEENKGSIALKWMANQTTETSHFEIEHSLDDYSWNHLAWINVDPSFLAQSNYQYVHQSPQSGRNYYRLKMVLLDGEVHYSQIRSLIFEPGFDFQLYPNPTSDRLYISGWMGLEMDVQISDHMGRTIRQQSWQGEALEVKNLPKGVYILKIRSNQFVFEQSFIRL